MKKGKIFQGLITTTLIAVIMMGCSNGKKEPEKSVASTESVIVQAQKHFESKEYSKAIDEYKKAIQLSPKDIDIRLKLSDVYVKMQQYAKAEDILMGVLKINSDRLDTYDRLMRVYDNMAYDAEYLFESCKKNSINISSKTKEKLMERFDILEENSKEKSKESFKQEKFITIQATSIRNAPRLHESKVIKTVEKGANLLKISNEKVYDIDPDGDSRFWYNVKTEDGIAGWVSEKALNGTNKDGKKSSSDFDSSYNYSNQSERTYFATQDTNVRTSPNYYEDGSNILKAIKKGDILIEINPIWTYEQDAITGRDRCWINVRLSDGTVGWISKRALDMTNR